MALIDAGPRSATVIAETDCVVVSISEKQFLFMVGEAPYFGLSVMRVLVERLRQATKPCPPPDDSLLTALPFRDCTR